MKKLFIFITLVAMSVSAVQCMEKECEQKGFTLSSDDRVFVVDRTDPRAPKKQKTEENSAVVNNPVINNDVAKTFVCLYCEKAFLIQNNLMAHQTFSHCARKIEEKKNG